LPIHTPNAAEHFLLVLVDPAEGSRSNGLTSAADSRQILSAKSLSRLTNPFDCYLASHAIAWPATAMAGPPTDLPKRGSHLD
jgi:hypothetical protein